MKILTGNKFPLGQMVMTRGISEGAEKEVGFQEFLGESLDRYSKGYWGDICEEDWGENEISLKPETQGRLMGVYTFREDIVIWIITEWDRSVTTILLPSDY